MAGQAPAHELLGEADQSHASSSAYHTLELEARVFDLVCCRLEGPVGPYDSGSGSEATLPASKSPIASSRSHRAFESACRRPGVGTLNRGTLSLPRIPRLCAACRDDVVLLGGMAKIAGSKNAIPLASSLGLLYVLRGRPPRPMNVRGGPAAEDEDRSPGTRARAQAPARLNNEEKPVTLLDAPISIGKGTRGIHDDGVGLGGEVEVGEERGDVLVVDVELPPPRMSR